MQLNGKVALVTGASRGIGKSIALELSKAGASVIINYNKDFDGAASVMKDIKDSGGYGIIEKADVSDYKEVKQMIEKIIKVFGKLDILVNNAGIAKIKFFADMTQEEIEKIIDVDLKGTLYCCNAALPNMLQRKTGNVINISSIWGNVGASCEAVYSAAKGGINSFTKALAKEVAPSGIRVNGIAPGIIDTQMNNNLSLEEKNLLIEDIPLMRLGKGTDIGKLVVFLCSDDAKYITSQVITVDGGFL